MNNNTKEYLEKAEKKINETVEEIKNSEVGKMVIDKITSIINQAKTESEKVWTGAKKLYDNPDHYDDDLFADLEKEESNFEDKLKDIYDKGAKAVNDFLSDPKVKDTANKGLDALKNIYETSLSKIKTGYEDIKNNPDVQKTFANLSDKVNKGAEQAKAFYDTKVNTEKNAETLDNFKNSADKYVSKAKDTYEKVMADPKVKETVDTVKESYDKAMENPQVKDTVDTIKRGFRIIGKTLKEAYNDVFNDKN